MAVPVSLQSVVDELEGLTDECVAYLNRQTGELCTVRDEEAAAVEGDIDPDNLPDWLEDELPKIREILEADVWLPLPTTFDIHEWSIMDDFARSIDDSAARDELLGAIHGRGAFRCFKDSIHRHKMQEDWYDFRIAALERIAAGWLDEHGVPYTR